MSPYPPNVDDEIRVVGLNEYKEAARSLAEAFAVDDTCRYFLDTPDRAHWTEQQKWELHVAILEYITYSHILKGLVTTVGPNYGAVALWMPPNTTNDDWLTLLRSGLWRLQYKLSAEGKKRFFQEFLPLLHDTKHAALGAREDDAWYLVYIGTRPQSRGRGYARKLIEQITAQADKEGRPCYLESSNAINPKIYRKMGFQEVRRIHLQRAERNICLDIMIREPGAGPQPEPEKPEQLEISVMAT
ncbi:hypothetical protein M501DRAFT_934726 [Patellaria atrata CBS 101060]|uniref:N-acetyltransferase domain-containing protein n=1 Tax=Patellaria atrata CBS 101060 TaxID=1346257 RepID=A0A9P4VR17_9PEZI|nr:hypothetical protein M501DRAFT_934726 [Patellaria atrata CBS 101060]